MQHRMHRAYRYLAQNWNAIAAATSMFGVIVFGLVPPLQRYLPAFIVLGANAIVWTLIEIKVSLRPAATEGVLYPNMRVARSAIVREIGSCLGRTTRDRPLRIILVGGRMRSMSDVLREVCDNLRNKRVKGHLDVRLFCLEPGYISSRRLPGLVPADKQADRNSAYASVIRSIASEVEGLKATFGADSSIDVTVSFYAEDPHVYAYVIGDSIIYWGTYLWLEERSDFTGPENPCYRLDHRHPWFDSVRQWLVLRTNLYEADGMSTSHRPSVPA